VSGTSVEVNGYYFSYTLGEPVVSTVFGNMHFLSQGFQQPALINDDPSNPDDSFDAVDVFPNPVSERLTVSFRIRELNTYFIEISDLSGRLLVRKKLTDLVSQDVTFDFSSFAEGMYLVHVFSSVRKMDRVFKIEKL